MAKAKTASKNNPSTRGDGGKQKKYNDMLVVPFFYYGKHAGHGNYMAAKYKDNDKMVVDANSQPLSWSSISVSE